MTVKNFPKKIFPAQGEILPGLLPDVFQKSLLKIATQPILWRWGYEHPFMFSIAQGVLVLHSKDGAGHIRPLTQPEISLFQRLEILQELEQKISDFRRSRGIKEGIILRIYSTGTFNRFSIYEDKKDWEEYEEGFPQTLPHLFPLL